MRATADLVRRHWLFWLLLGGGLVLRAITQIAYEPALLFIDSKKYIFGTDFTSNIWGSFDPLGYSLLVLRPVLMFTDLAVVALVQHVLGMAMAGALYVLMLRRGVARWLAALAVAPVLLDAYQLNAEQTIMPDVLFEALLVAGIVLLLWRPRPGLFLIILAGLALGASAPVRQVGEALIAPALVYVVVAARGWRTRLLHGAVLTFCFALPVVGYMGYSAVILQYGFELSNMGNAYLYGRAAHAADCTTLKIPADERPLCPSAPVSATLGVDGLVNAQTAPRVLYQPVDIQAGLLIDTLPMQQALAYSVLAAAAAAGGRRHRQGLGEDLRPDQEHRAGRHPDLPLAVPVRLPVLPARRHPPRREQRQPGLRPGGRRRVRAGPLEGRHRAAVLPAARRVHAGTGVPARAAGRDRRDPHLPAAPGSGARAGLRADHRVRGRRAAGRGPVRVLLALPATRPDHAAHRGSVRGDRAGPAHPGAAAAGRDRYGLGRSAVAGPVATAGPGQRAGHRRIRAGVLADARPGRRADIRMLASGVVYEDNWMRLRRDEIERRDGSRGTYAYIEKRDFALVIPAENDGFHLVEEYRYPIGRRTWSFPQGGFPHGESGEPEDLARLELAQETGLRARELVRLGYLHGSHGTSSQAGHYFLATGLSPGPAGAGAGRAGHAPGLGLPGQVRGDDQRGPDHRRLHRRGVRAAAAPRAEPGAPARSVSRPTWRPAR